MESNPQLFTGHLRPLDAILYLLERDVSCQVGISSMLRLHVDAERREAAIVCRAQAIFANVLRGFEDHLADGFGRLDVGCQLEREPNSDYEISRKLKRDCAYRVDDADEDELSDAVRIVTHMFRAELVYLRLVLLRL